MSERNTIYKGSGFLLLLSLVSLFEFGIEDIVAPSESTLWFGGSDMHFSGLFPRLSGFVAITILGAIVCNGSPPQAVKSGR